MKNALILILLAIPSCCQETCQAQSIVISGQKRSILVSGRGDEQPKPVVVFAEEKPVQKSTEPKPQPQPATPPKPAMVREVRQERYLVSEPWCGYCPAAKARFLASGGKPENVIDIAKARQMGQSWSIERGQIEVNPERPNYAVPYEFTMEIVVEAPDSKPAPQVITQPQATLPARYVQYGSQMIDLETYSGCDSRHCGMCKTIRAQQAQYRAAKQAAQYRQTSIDLPDHQQPTPPELMEQVISELQLSPSDVLADFGCGDGRILIAAVERYGCRAIGIEIDPARADVAREAVQAAGLQDRIEIITGDALRFWPADHGVTAAVAYLYPDLLEQLRPQFEQVRVLVSPCHEVPGLEMVRRGDVWLRRTKGQG